MKVLLCNYEFPPMGGGAGNATSNIARELAGLGLDVTVLTSRLSGQPTAETSSGVTIHRVLSLRKGIHDCGFRGAFTYAVAAAAWMYRRPPCDLIHYFFSLPTGALSLLPGLHRAAPYLISLRGSDVPHYDQFNRPLQWVHRMARPITRRIWHRATRVVALSSGLRATAQLTSPNLAIDVIPNGVEAELFRPAQDQPKNEDGPHLRLICVSRLIERKGIQHLIKAVAALGDGYDIQLTLVGTGPYESPLRQLASELGVQNRISFFGYCAREDLPRLYQAADVFVLPSMVESFGLAFAEAMACGLPVIAGRTGGVPDLVGPENGILVEPGDPLPVRRALQKLASDPALRRQMGQANRTRIVKNFGWLSVAKRYLTIYGEILDRQPMPSSASGSK